MTILTKASVSSCLSWESMTTAVNEIKSPGGFIRKLLYGRSEQWSTETINLSFWQRGRKIAPFVRRNSEALIIDGVTKDFHAVIPPNIRIKIPMTAYEKIMKRTPGTVVMPQRGRQMKAIQEAIAMDQAVLADDATNSEEWLAAMSLQGSVSYTDAAGDVWTVTFPKSGANTFAVSVFWDDADPSLPVPLLDIKDGKKVISDAVDLQPTTLVFGSEAAAAMLSLPSIYNLLDKKNVKAGEIDLTSQWQETGAIFLGMLGGLPCWEYPRTMSVNGVDVDLIRPKYIEMITARPAARAVMHYAAIDDMDALSSGLIAVKRFSKSWKTPDPSVQWSLLHSCPLAVPERPDAHVSMKVVSG